MKVRGAMSNHEKKTHTDSVHILMAFARTSHGEKKSNCIRTVDKGRGDELEVLEAKLKVIGGYWRIHKTVNARDVKKAMKHLMCALINNPEKASYIDSEWRTALLQSHCIYGEKRFMLDIDTENKSNIEVVLELLEEQNILECTKYKSPKGWHYITKPFDTRVVCELEFVTLIRDGYYFIKEVGQRTAPL